MNGITVLICTHNGAKRLPDTLRYVAAQQVSSTVDWEVLLISNASSDNTVEVAQSLQHTLNFQVPFRVLEEPVSGKENALIRGFNDAAYENIVIIDDDNWIAPNYLTLVDEIMSAHPEIGVLGGHAEGMFEIPAPDWFETFQAVYAVGPQNGGKSGPLPAHEGYLYGAGSVVRKSAWLKLLAHGFQFTTSTKRGKIIVSGEDVELGDAMQLAGYKLWYDDRLRFKHFMFKERLTWSYLMRIGQGTASSQLTSIVYYFIFRNPDLTESKFRFLYNKRLVWLAGQMARQPGNLLNAAFRRDKEGLISNFETLRLFYNFQTSLKQREEAVKVFRQISALRQRLSGK
ncbi:glycosyltransferase family 2 protein [Hymenobacter sp. BT635]|uniref:Glycosyltransferase family 2 protein n=1 Tax=Hymenobacter nitidus TaxID=2880929 RepID=A0ABS8AHJ1_9BACT|nr:glycosyltransferase family 2 protein [Hymenobacter nitidus]